MSEDGSDGSAEAEPVRLWKRPPADRTVGDDDGMIPIDDLHLHRYCPVFPYGRSGTGDPAYDGAAREAERDLRSTETDGSGVEPAGADGDTEPVRFVDGPVRLALRHTPTVILLATVIFFGSAEFADGVDGISAFFPLLSTGEWVGIVGAVLLYAALLGLILDVGLFEPRELYEATVVYGLLGFLSLGTVVSISLVVTGTTLATDPMAFATGEGIGEVPNNIVFTSGYLLLLLVCGLFVYDGLLRTEHLFEGLSRAEVVENRTAYEEDRRTLVKLLTHSPFDRTAGETESGSAADGSTDPEEDATPFREHVPVRTASLFAVLFLSQYAVVWFVGRGPQNLDYWVTTVGNLTLNFVLVVVAFKFVVLVAWFYRLLNEDRYASEADATSSDGEPSTDGESSTGITQPTGEGVDRESTPHEPDRTGVALGYRPFHADGRAGYRDLGKFATRVNLLLIFAGFYLVYRLFVQGARVLPGEMVPDGFAAFTGELVWFASFLAPVFVYGLVACAWIYYSFWQIHLRMLREREWRYFTRTDGYDADDDWTLRTSAPVWPVNGGVLWTLVSGTFSPVVIYLVEVI